MDDTHIVLYIVILSIQIVYNLDGIDQNYSVIKIYLNPNRIPGIFELIRVYMSVRRFIISAKEHHHHMKGFIFSMQVRILHLLPGRSHVPPFV